MMFVSLCKDVEAQWQEIEPWFRREALDRDDVGYGTYRLDGGRIRGETEIYWREVYRKGLLIHEGELTPGGMRLKTSVENEPGEATREYVPLQAAQ